MLGTSSPEDPLVGIELDVQLNTKDSVMTIAAVDPMLPRLISFGVRYNRTAFFLRLTDLLCHRCSATTSRGAGSNRGGENQAGEIQLIRGRPC